MKSLFVMDPLERIQVSGDSTYVLMRECTDRGYPVWFCTPEHLYAEGGRPFATACPVRVTENAPYFRPESSRPVSLDAFDVVWMRKDPPFDMDYIFATYLLDMVGPQTLVVNDPVGLKRFNEKLWAMHYRELHPPTLLARDGSAIRAFVETHGKVVLKPWDGNGGRGVLVTTSGDRNLGAMIELLTSEGGRHCIAQAYLPEIEQGDKRILLFDGEPVGAMARIPSAGDHRGNMHVGASVRSVELSERDVEICRVLREDLKVLGMLFVGIDVIGDHLTEINVTSPTGIREINRLQGLRLEADLIDRVERRVAR